MSWKDTVLEAFDVFGPASLFVLSFTEAIVQPIPPDLLYIPMLANAMGNAPLVVWLWLVVTVSSVLGSLVGYWIGQRWGTSLMHRFGQERHLVKLEHLTERYGALGIFIAAFSPIPYKVLGWMAGMGHMAKRPFVLAGLLGRGLRFGLEAVLIGLYGAKARDVIMCSSTTKSFWRRSASPPLAFFTLCGSGGRESDQAPHPQAHDIVGTFLTGTVMNRAQVAKMPLAWCSQVHHYGFSSRRPGFESRREHINPINASQCPVFNQKNAEAWTVNVKHRSTLERPWLPSETPHLPLP